jgi:hypothetical protein
VAKAQALVIPRFAGEGPGQRLPVLLSDSWVVSEMTAAELRNVIVSPEYKQDVQDLSCFLASVKQERPLVYCLAKQLWKRGYQFQLESERTDLVLNERRFEFKFTYDCDMGVLSKELDNSGDKLLKGVCKDKPAHGWVALHRLYTDMVCKKADVFVWIILARDLSKIDKDAQNGICVSTLQRKWNKQHPYLDRTYLNIADRFLDKIREEKQFSVIKEEIQTSGTFPSTYNYWLCEFENASGAIPRK